MGLGLLAMSAGERERASVVQQIVDRRLPQKLGVERLGINLRQMKWQVAGLAHGLPLALYSDRYGIFRVNAKEAASGDGLAAWRSVWISN